MSTKNLQINRKSKVNTKYYVKATCSEKLLKNRM